MRKLYLDVESAGILGDLHTIQYSVDRGQIQTIRVSQADDEELFELFKMLDSPKTVLVAFNASFDIWKLYQFFEPDGAFKCRVIDLYQHALKSKPLCFYPLIGGKSVVILRKLPNQYVEEIVSHLSDKMWQILPPIADLRVERTREKGGFTTVKFKVRVPAKLKSLARLFLDEKEVSEIIQFEDVLYTPGNFRWEDEDGVERQGFKEDQRFPTQLSDLHRQLWEKNEGILDSEKGERAILYGEKDIEYLWKLEDWLKSQGNKIEIDSDDTCTHIVAYTRYHGFPVDKEKAELVADNILREMESIEEELDINIQSPEERLWLLKEHAYIPGAVISTSKEHLNILLEEQDIEILTPRGLELAEKMARYKPLAQRRKQLEVVTLGDGRVYPDFVVLGTSTYRMRGTGGLNFQGISREGRIRELFLTSQGGDFDGLEWCLAANIYQDEEMLRGIREGIDPHLLAVALLNEESYEDLLSIKADPDHPRFQEIKEERNKKKRINFGVLYQAGPVKIGEELGISPEEAEEKMNSCYFSHYQSLGKTKEQLNRDFCTADFESWSKSSVGAMSDHVVGVFGDERWVCFERYIADYLWRESDKISAVAQNDETKVLRREEKGEQNIRQAIRSACLGAASGIQKSVMRQLGNFKIQNAGARLTKLLMERIWDKHRLPMMNIHDEIDIPAGVSISVDDVWCTVEEFLQEYRDKFEGLSMIWGKTQTWADK